MFSDAFLDDFANRVALRVLAQLGQTFGAGTRRLMTVSEAAQYIGRSKQALYHLANQGKIPTKRQGSRLFFDRVELDGWIADLSD